MFISTEITTNTESTMRRTYVFKLQNRITHFHNHNHWFVAKNEQVIVVTVFNSSLKQYLIG